MNSNEQPRSRTKWLLPLLAALAAVGVVTLLIAPMMMMEPRNLPIAVANLDKGRRPRRARSTPASSSPLE